MGERYNGVVSWRVGSGSEELGKVLRFLERSSAECLVADLGGDCRPALLGPVCACLKIAESRHHKLMTIAAKPTTCELCTPVEAVVENELAYARYDNNSLSRGHLLVVPKRHVASFFDMTSEEQTAVLGLLNQAQGLIQNKHRPDGYNIGVNIGKAGGQSRMHVHIHLIPRYVGDVADPRGGIRCVLAGRTNGT